MSIECGMLVTCRMQYAMSVSTVLQFVDAVSIGGNYAFATVRCLVLHMCILISCNSVCRWLWVCLCL